MRRQLGLVVFFGLVACLALYQPLLHSGTHIPGSQLTDYFHFHWIYWWVDTALQDPQLSVYYTDYVLFPSVNNLAYHTMALAYYPLWKVGMLFTNTLGAMNLIFVTTFTLTGYCTFVLLRREKIALPLALLGAVAIEVSPLAQRAVWYTNPNLLGTFWYPITLLLWGEVARAKQQRTRLLWATLMGLALGGSLLTDLQYGMFLPFLLLPYGLLTLYQARPTHLLLAGSLAIALALGLWWWWGAMRPLLDYNESDILRSNIADTWGMSFPTGYLWGAPDYYLEPRLGGVIPFIFLAGLLLGAKAPRSRWFWLLVALLPLILSFGATLTLAGREVALPYRLYHDLIGGIFRFPERFGTLFLLPALLFGGLSLSPVLRQKRHWWLWLTPLSLWLVFINLRTLHPMEIQKPLPIYDFYRQMAADPDPYVVVEVPTGAGSGIHYVGDPTVQVYQYYGTVHHKKMINGHISRIPTSHWWWLRTDDPLLSWLGQRRYLEPEVVEAQLADIIPRYPLGYIVIHQDKVQGEPSTNEEIIGYLNSLPHFFCPPVVEENAVAFRAVWLGCQTTRTLPAREGAYWLDIGAAGDEVFLGTGWHYREQIFDVSLRWAGRTEQTLLYVDLPPREYTLTLTAQAFWQERQLTVLANGIPLGTQTVKKDILSELHYVLPAAAFRDNKQLTLTLAYTGRDTPQAVLGSSDPRYLAVALDWIRFEEK